MSYGDTGDWDGTIGTASPPTEFTIDFRCTFQTGGGPQTKACQFSVETGQTEADVAALHAQRWNAQHGSGARHDTHVNRRHRVSFDGEILSMEVKGYKTGDPPPAEYQHVEFGEKTEVVNGLSILNS